ncbi:hypothetical protein EI94DRAFT_1830264 [Lactarius quietus]|nr:hypothetical protein EI94DRAFT_1830264 [Lactarius quietus]
MTTPQSLQVGSASIIGIACLENARQDSDGDQTKALIFDTQFYVAPGATVVGALRYFNANNLIFEDIGKYFVYANITKYSSSATVRATELEPEDYDFVGDIVWLVPADIEDARVPAYIHATGTATTVDTTNATFHVDSYQYTYAFRSQQLFPIHALIPDSPRYKSKKPIPANNSYVGIAGRLTRICPTSQDSENRFHIDVDNVTFLGRPPTIPVRSSDTAPLPATPTRKRGLYDFDSPNQSSRKTDKKSPSAPVVTTSNYGTRSKGKRKAGSSVSTAAGSNAFTLTGSSGSTSAESSVSTLPSGEEGEGFEEIQREEGT